MQAIAEEIAADEIAHVEFLRAALGPAAVPCPEMDIGSAFKTAANFAASTILEPRFDPYANDIFFLHAAFIFEDLGVTAYKGAVEPLTALVEACAAPPPPSQRHACVGNTHSTRGHLPTVSTHADHVQYHVCTDRHCAVFLCSTVLRQSCSAKAAACMPRTPCTHAHAPAHS